MLASSASAGVSRDMSQKSSTSSCSRSSAAAVGLDLWPCLAWATCAQGVSFGSGGAPLGPWCSSIGLAAANACRSSSYPKEPSPGLGRLFERWGTETDRRLGFC